VDGDDDDDAPSGKYILKQKHGMDEKI